MTFKTDKPDEDHLLALKCEQDGNEALVCLRDKYHASLSNILRSRGGNATEVEDLLADLWADCVPQGEDKLSLLGKFNGKCTLMGWLATVATRRLIDLKRKQTRRSELVMPGAAPSEQEPFDRLPAALLKETEDSLVNLLRDSLQAAFDLCPPQAMVLLRLRYVHGVSQRELVRVLGWHESKVSRTLSQAMDEIEAETLRQIKKRDPWLELNWQDFLDLCETEQLGFL